MTHVKNQHIVPEFLLKNWIKSGENTIWSFDKGAINKNWKEVKPRASRSVPTEEFFYDKIKGQKEDSHEYQLQQIETKAAPVVSKLNESKDLDGLSLIEKDIIVEFITFQMLRTKGNYKNAERISNELREFIGQHIELKQEGNTRDFWLETLNTATEYKKHLLDKTWILFESNDEFYLSDNPIVLQNSTNNREHRGNLGLNSKGIEIYCPLSSSVILALFCNKTVTRTIPNVQCESGNIENLNWLQVVYSDRFIFSKNNNFDLVYDMIAKNELMNIN